MDYVGVKPRATAVDFCSHGVFRLDMNSDSGFLKKALQVFFVLLRLNISGVYHRAE